MPYKRFLVYNTLLGAAYSCMTMFFIANVCCMAIFCTAHVTKPITCAIFVMIQLSVAVATAALNSTVKLFVERYKRQQ